MSVEMQRIVNEESVKKNNWILNTLSVSHVEPNKLATDNTKYIQIILSLQTKIKEVP